MGMGMGMGTVEDPPIPIPIPISFTHGDHKSTPIEARALSQEWRAFAFRGGSEERFEPGP